MTDAEHAKALVAQAEDFLADWRRIDPAAEVEGQPELILIRDLAAALHKAIEGEDDG